MALKIVHLCDIHSEKGEDVPAQYAHTIALDGGTFAIDLCPSCDQERFLPLAAFLQAFGLLTDGEVDPREAVAENLRATVAQLSGAQQQQPRKPQKPATAPVRAQEPQEPQEPATAPQGASESPRSPKPAVVPVAAVDVDPENRSTVRVVERRRAVLAMLRESPVGMRSEQIADALADGSNPETLSGSVFTPLRNLGLIEFLAHKWWAPENVPADLRAESERLRGIVAARNQTPRICPVDGTETGTPNDWEKHTLSAHGVKPVELLGLTCPFDGEEFTVAQVLGMHARKEHDCTHTPLLFQRAAEAGDPLGVIADIRKRFA